MHSRLATGWHALAVGEARDVNQTLPCVLLLVRGKLNLKCAGETCTLIRPICSSFAFFFLF